MLSEGRAVRRAGPPTGGQRSARRGPRGLRRGTGEGPRQPVAVAAKIGSPDRQRKGWTTPRSVPRQCSVAARPSGRRRLAAPVRPGDRGARSRPRPSSSDALSARKHGSARFGCSRSPRSWPASWPRPISFPAALKHFELAIGLDSSAESGASIVALRPSSPIRQSLPGSRTPTLWRTCPRGLRARCAAVRTGAAAGPREGLWDSAAAAFELLSADRVAGHAADYNLGLCRLWLGDHEAAVAALRRWIERERPDHQGRRSGSGLPVDRRIDRQGADRASAAYLAAPRSRRLDQGISEAIRRSSTGEERHLDPDDEESPEVASFHWLDRPGSNARTGLTRQEIPHHPGGRAGRPGDRRAGDPRRRPAERPDRSVRGPCRQVRSPRPPADESHRPG